MSSLHRGDDDLHYCDNSHRWIAPSDIDQEVWEAELATHLEKHRAAMGTPAADGRGKCRTRGLAAPAPAMPARIIPARRSAAPAVPAQRSVPTQRPGAPERQPAGRAGQAGKSARRASAREPIGRQPGVPAGQR